PRPKMLVQPDNPSSSSSKELLSAPHPIAKAEQPATHLQMEDSGAPDTKDDIM
ncbi:Hypothetical predicted protein, partial [Pelobates cultripes]